MTHPRARANAELGRRFAELLAEPLSHQLGVCGKLGIPWRTHVRWMAADAEPDSDLAAYQCAVLEALDRQRIEDLKDIDVGVERAPGTHVGTFWNVRKHRHESRFRRFYEDATSKVEVSGPEGAPMQHEHRQLLPRAEALAELRKLAAEDPEIAKALGDGEDE